MNGDRLVAVVMLVSLVVGLWLQGPPRNGGSTPNPTGATETNAPSAMSSNRRLNDE